MGVNYKKTASQNKPKTNTNGEPTLNDHLNGSLQTAQYTNNNTALKT